MKKVQILIFFCLAGGFLSAQEIQLNENPLVNQLLRNWVNQNRSKPGVSGWRLQITASTDRVLVEDKRNAFRQAYPDVPADWVHEKPYYKLRVGAFRNKQEAILFASTLIGYTGSYPVPDEAIHPRDFIE
jgi:SPOR domain